MTLVKISEMAKHKYICHMKEKYGLIGEIEYPTHAKKKPNHTLLLAHDHSELEHEYLDESGNSLNRKKRVKFKILATIFPNGDIIA